VSLTITDHNGQTLTSSVTLATRPPLVVVSVPSITSRTYNADYTLTTLVFSATASGGSGGLSYAWSTTASGGTVTWTSGTTLTPTLLITSTDLASGTKTVTLTVTDATNGQQASQTIILTASPSAC
jgi:hypothetical protein